MVPENKRGPTPSSAKVIGKILEKNYPVPQDRNEFSDILEKIDRVSEKEGRRRW